MPITNTMIGQGTFIHHPDLCNIYGAKIGNDCRIGPFVEIQSGVIIGDHCKVQSHVFICQGVTIGSGVFVGHGVVFTNDRHPKAMVNGRLASPGDWVMELTRVGDRASIGSNATILPGVTIGDDAVIGAGAVVSRDVLPHQVVVGNPAVPIHRPPQQQEWPHPYADEPWDVWHRDGK